MTPYLLVILGNLYFAFTGFQRTQISQLAFDRNSDGIGRFSHLRRNGDIMRKISRFRAIGPQPSAHHYQRKSGHPGIGHARPHSSSRCKKGLLPDRAASDPKPGSNAQPNLKIIVDWPWYPGPENWPRI